MSYFPLILLCAISLTNADNFGGHHGGGMDKHHEIGFAGSHGIGHGGHGIGHGIGHGGHGIGHGIGHGKGHGIGHGGIHHIENGIKGGAGGYGNDIVHGLGGIKHGGGGYGKGQEYYAPVKYEFGYGVSDPYHGTNFGHSESRDGKYGKGEYYVNLPDGRLQKVSYYTDEWGYHPTVTYEGKAHFPSHGKGYGGHQGGHAGGY